MWTTITDSSDGWLVPGHSHFNTIKCATLYVATLAEDRSYFLFSLRLGGFRYKLGACQGASGVTSSQEFLTEHYTQPNVIIRLRWTGD
jgi:hypothetical protein